MQANTSDTLAPNTETKLGLVSRRDAMPVTLSGPPHQRRGTLCTLALLLSAAPAFAANDSLPIELVWKAPSSCPTQAHLIAEVRRMLGNQAGAQRLESLQVRAVVVQAGPTWSVDITTNTDTFRGERRIEADSCRAIARASALVIALTFDPEAVALLKASEPEAKRPDATPPPRTPPRGESGSTSSPTIGLLEAGLASRWASLPGGGLAGWVGTSVLWPRIRAGVDFTYFLPRQRTLDPPAGGRVGLMLAGAEGCVQAKGKQLDLEGCFGGEIGRMWANGTGVDITRSSSFTWGALRAGMGLRWWFSPHLATHIGMDGVLPLYRPAFVLDRIGLLHQPSPMDIQLAIGLEVPLWGNRFPKSRAQGSTR